MNGHHDSDALVERYFRARTLERLPEVVRVDGEVPPNPPALIQTQFVGSSYQDAYREAASFVEVVDQFATRHLGAGIGSLDRVVDFGSGWGRISRMLLAHRPAPSIYALDVDLDMTALVNATLPGVNALTIAPQPPTVLGDAIVGGAVAYSVFSHLSGPGHEAWAAEFGRVIRPGGFAAITVLDAVFFDQVASAQAEVAAETADPFATELAKTFADLDAARAGYARGEVQYAPVGGGGTRAGEDYGWTVSPADYVERLWGKNGFRIVEWVPSGVLFEQALVFMVRIDEQSQNATGEVAGFSDLARRGLSRAKRALRARHDIGTR